MPLGVIELSKTKFFPIRKVQFTKKLHKIKYIIAV
jgi:hypothetical protein